MKQRNNAKTFTEAVMELSGMTYEELVNPVKDPYLPGISEAAETMKSCIEKKMPVTLIGDFDDDGESAMYILSEITYALSGKYPNKVIIPDRVRDGYGFNMKFVDDIVVNEHGGLLIVADTGITAIEQVAAAKTRGITVIILDHHLPLDSGKLPDADVVVDPHVKIDGTEQVYSDYCAAGLCYRLAKELLGERKDLLAIAAVATIADVVPLKGDNRNIVRNGMIALDEGHNRALEILMENRKIEKIDEEAIGFTIAPVFNSVGRMPEGNPTDVVNALTGYDPRTGNLTETEVVGLIESFVALNQKRKDLEKNVMASMPPMDGQCPIIAITDGSLQGIAGILAGKYAEKFHVPAFVLTEQDGDVLKGSARAGKESGVHIKEMLDTMKAILLSYGGHEKAAGLSLMGTNLDAFRRGCEAYIESIGGISTSDEKYYDLVVYAKDLREILAEKKSIGPFGEGCPNPTILIKGFRLTPNSRGNLFVDSDNNPDWFSLHGINADASCFDPNVKEKWFAAGQPAVIDILGTIRSEWFRGKERIKINMIDFTYPGDPENEDNQEKKEENMDTKTSTQATETKEKVNVPVKLLKDIPMGGKDYVTCALRDITEQTAKNGSTYVDLLLIDKSGKEETAKMWDTTKQNLLDRNIMPGCLYTFGICVQNFQNQRSYLIQGSDRANDILLPPEYEKLEDYRKSNAPCSGEVLYDQILVMVDKVCSPNLQNLVHSIYESNKDKLIMWAAATSYHHNYYSGLIWHTEAMVESAYMLARTNASRGINAGLVVAGCALHDIGKLKEMETDSFGTAQYTLDGNLFGHLLIGYQMVRDEAIKQGIQDDEEVKCLLHIIASHHKNQDWGAIKSPSIREASMVSYIDQMNADDEKFVEEYSQLEAGQMMETRSKTLKGVAVYKPLFAQ